MILGMHDMTPPQAPVQADNLQQYPIVCGLSCGDYICVHQRFVIIVLISGATWITFHAIFCVIIYHRPQIQCSPRIPTLGDNCRHYSDVIMTTIASQITSLTIVYSTVYSGADQSKHQRSASLVFVWGIHRGPVSSPHKWPVTRKMFPFDDVIMGASLKWTVWKKCQKLRFWYFVNI